MWPSPGKELDPALVPVASCTPNAVSPGRGGMSMEVLAGSEHRQSHQHGHPSSLLHLSKINTVKSRQ